MIILTDKIRQLFQEELAKLEEIKSVCKDPQYQDNPLISQYKSMATVLGRTLQSMMKLTRISDSQQSYLQELQQQLAHQLQMAAKVQKLMLQGDYEDQRIVLKTLYAPSQLVSGDYYRFNWSKSGKVLNGCLVDITGHGVATALQTAAVSSIVTETMEATESWSINDMHKLNTQLSNYLAEDNFAAMIVFSLDFAAQRLSCYSGGINYFLASAGADDGWLQLPGSYLGLFPEADFELLTMPFQSGDCFYFMTDGLSDRILHDPAIVPQAFAATVEQFRLHAADQNKKDDTTAICLQIR